VTLQFGKDVRSLIIWTVSKDNAERHFVDLPLPRAGDLLVARQKEFQ
jgi:hypothetical protein